MVMERWRPNLRLQEARALKGWSQEELATQLGTTFETVSRWRRRIMLPSPYFRTRLCAVFGMTAEALGLLFRDGYGAPLVALIDPGRGGVGGAGQRA